MIVEANGTALSYVIRQNSVPDHSNKLTWDEKARLAAPQTGNKYKFDTLVVNNIVTRNISETSHTYTYIQPKIKKKMAKLILTHSELGTITRKYVQDNPYHATESMNITIPSML